ncbi:ATP-binding cassette domain-containing protein [Aestuariivirga sp.]|uniref:ATP-binding cassette domain-containing protein n=1 Tax=Aestuariivirga sp. TaxID=2650926 RepID=UPI0039E2E9D9
MSLVFEKISKSFGPVRALEDVSFEVRPGECRALYGGNGSGKSTVAKIASGTFAATAGRVMIGNTALAPASPATARNLGVGITFQELSLIPDLSVGDNVVIGSVPTRYGLFQNRSKAREMARAELEKVKLGHLADWRVDALQTGEKYLVELAKAMFLKPKFLIIDELTATMHASEVGIFAGLLDAHLKSGGSAVFVSHRLPELRRFCSTISVLRNGRLVFDGVLSEVSDKDLVVWAGGDDASEVPELRLPHAQSTTMVELRQLRPFHWSKPMDLTLYKGEIVGIGGLPDQGQKPLLRLLAGLAPPKNGETVTLDSEELPVGSAVAVAQKGVAFVTGDRDEVVFVRRPIRENMLAPFLAMRGRKLPDDQTLIAALAQLSTRYSSLDAPMNSLSGGNQQKILIARCLLLNPKLIVAEDSTKGIDVSARNDVHHLLREMAHRQDASVIVTSSDDLELAELCDRVLVMENGAVIADLRRAEGRLTTEAIVSSYMRQKKAA